MKLFEDLKYRNIVYDMTNPDVEDILNNGKAKFYMGTDPTADSLHVGHLFSQITAKRLQKYGHEPVLLIGGATGLIGDPSGRSSERDLLTLDTTIANSKAIEAQVRTFMDCEFVNNYDWIKEIDMITFLRDYGKNFNINIMMSKDSVKSRLENGISFTEFSYQILQALDFLHLYQNNGVNMQIGGQDQWGNIVAGSELIRKVTGHESKVYGFTFPLITKSDGTKFGKTAGGTVWLDPKRTTPYEFYQFWFNTADDNVIARLKQFTFLTKEEIDALEISLKEEPHKREAQKSLAKEVTKFVHGEEKLTQALNITDALFSGNVGDLTVDEISQGFKGFPNTELSSESNLVDLLIEAKLASSKRESREFIKNGAVSINGEKVSDLEFIVKKENAIGNLYTVIRRGKKKYALINHK